MKAYRAPLIFVALFAVLLIPHISLGATTDFLGPIIPKNIEDCPAGWAGLVAVITGIVSFAISIGIVIAVLILAYAGFLLVLNPLNAENRSQARGMLINAAIGLVLTLGAWLLVNTLLGALGYKGGISGATSALFSGGDTCIIAKTGASTLGNGTSTGGGSGASASGCSSGQSCSAGGTCQNTSSTAVLCNGTSCQKDYTCDTSVTPNACKAPQSCTPPGEGGDVAAKVCSAASGSFGNLSTANAPGTNNGRNACAWAVSTIVQKAGYGGFSSNVATLESQLKGGRGTAESQSAAVCGDIVVQDGDHHVGICMDQGCDLVYSNSSSNASFSWSSGPDFHPSYTGGVGRFYRLNN